MASLVAKLLLLMSVLLMPFAMSAAAASGPADHKAMSHESMGHCPDPVPADDSAPGIERCWSGSRPLNRLTLATTRLARWASSASSCTD